MRVSGLLRGVTRISIPIIAMFFILTGSIGMFLNLLYEQASERLFALDEALTGPAVSDEKAPGPFEEGGMASQALLAIDHNKTIHGFLLFWLQKPYSL